MTGQTRTGQTSRGAGGGGPGGGGAAAGMEGSLRSAPDEGGKGWRARAAGPHLRPAPTWAAEVGWTYTLILSSTEHEW